jgi:hypothetical protein
MGNVVGLPHTQSTYIYRVPQCMSTRWNWDSPTPSLASECALPPRTRGGGAHTPAGEGLGKPQFRRLETSTTLCPHTSGNSGARFKSGGRDGGQGHQEAAAVQGRSSFTPG